MNVFGCDLAYVLEKIVQLYIVLLIVYAVISWLPDLRGRWVDVLARFIEPVLAPVRRVIPPIGGFDIAFIVVFLLLQVAVLPLIGSLGANFCYAVQ